jgi:hypothetical protein
MGFGIKKDVTSNVTPSTIVYFDKATPTEVGVVFTPNTPATTDVLYVSSVDASTWIWDGLDYITYAPTTASTEWYLNGTTIDAGSNKTASIQRSGAIYVNVDSYFNDIRIGKGSGNISSNTIVGDKALISNSTGSQIVAIGYGALQNNTASYNTAVGWSALTSNTTGSNNIAIGKESLYLNTTASNNTGVGNQTLLNNVTGSNNTTLGYQGLYYNTGSFNTAVGSSSLTQNTTGASNVALGFNSLYYNTTGSNNVGIGQEALYKNITGGINVGIGYQAGVFLGDGTTNNTTSVSSVFIGASTKSLTNNDTNQIVIGYNAIGKGSNTVQLGNTSITNTYLQGSVTVNNAFSLPTTAPTSGQVLGYLGAGTTTWVSGSSSGICGIANSSGVYTYYATLSLAITAAVSGQTVDLLTDITETGSVTITTKTGVKINGNGYTYTLSVNDGTNAITQVGQPTEISNLKVVRTGRANNASGVVFYTNTSVNAVLKCSNVEFVNNYGVGVSLNRGTIYGLKVTSYGTSITTSYEYGYIYDCNLTSSASIGYDNSFNAGEVQNCTITASGSAIILASGSVYNSIGKSSTGYGIQATRVVNSTGISSTGIGVLSANGYNCVGISTSGVGLSGTFTNSTGISTSGYATSGGTKTNCTLISSSNYASFQENLNNCYLESTTNVPLWTISSKLINSCTAICLWNNAGGHSINTTSASTGVEIRSSSLSVTNASAYCINAASGSTFKYAVNTYKGSTTAVNSTNITQGITNTSDNQGNILI